MVITKTIAAGVVGEAVNENLTIEEIESRFPSEWILIEDPVTDEKLELRGGMVRWHSADRDEMYRKALESRAPRIAFLYTGKMPLNGKTIVL
jgi:hypothetical protein